MQFTARKMSIEASSLGLLEEALSGAFKYHAGLDTFLHRAGVAPNILQNARARAESKNTNYPRAPKRFVVRELTDILLSVQGGEKILSRLFDELRSGRFPEADEAAILAIQEIVKAFERDKENRREHALELEVRRKASADQASERATRYEAKEQERASLLGRFNELYQEANSQRRGYEFENLLKDLFKFEDLHPRGSFRNKGEEIDGSFTWAGRTYLVEAKWRVDRTPSSELSIFRSKLDGKSIETRGVFVSANGYTEDGQAALTQKGEARFICLDGAHIMRALQSGQSLVDIMNKAWRHASETGYAYLPVSKM